MKIFQGINEAAESTGLTTFFLRKGLEDGTIPHIKSGKKFLINVPALLKQMGVSDDIIAACIAGGNRDDQR